MAFEIATISYRLERRRGTRKAEAARTGLAFGAAAVFFCLIGAYVLMDKRFIVEGVLTLAELIVLTFAASAGFIAARQDAGAPRVLPRLVAGAATGALSGLCLTGLVVLMGVVDLRTVLVAAGPELTRALAVLGTPGSPLAAAAIVALGGAFGAAGAALAVAPRRLRATLLAGCGAVATAGLFRDVFVDILNNLGGRDVQRALFARSGLRPLPAALLFVAAAAAWGLLHEARRRWGGPSSDLAPLVAIGVAAAVLPFVTTDFIAQVLILVTLYALMAMGLNIELGMAGLVDLGFVAFYAVGAYTVGLLCSASPIAVADLSFWAAFPIAILCAAGAGLVFGLPVLRVRGDYLALATLGLGEIIRVLVVSDFLRPVLGGSQGIIAIQRPELFGVELNTPFKLYFFLALAIVGAIISVRLQHSRVGAWLAIREDEEVAQGLGIDLVANKLLAYTIGAAFAGAAGAVFAVLVGAVYPHSFQLLISVNLLSILVIGGLGSLPGVVVGALVLVGLPELLREFGEFRYLFYGLGLIAIVNLRAEGLWPAHRPEMRAVA